MSDDMSMGLPSSAGEHGVLRSMQEVAMSSQEASKMLRTYNIAWWGNNYYDVNELGHISVCPDPDVPEARVDLAQLVKTREAQGQRLPALFCFPQILQHRLRSINAAFKRARESYGYNGDYFLVYPIKVNQHRRVIESLIHSGEPLGLEAGSKAELMAVLAHAGMTRSVIVCNGYKDREYIRLALIGEKMAGKNRSSAWLRLRYCNWLKPCVKPGVSTACNYCTSTSVRRWRIFAISPQAFVNRRVSMWNCTSWASIFSASTSAAVWAWTMKAPVRSLTAP